MNVPLIVTSKYCNGCHTKNYSDASCLYINPKGICPCTNCLVKPTCRNECQEFLNYIIAVTDWNNEC